MIVNFAGTGNVSKFFAKILSDDFDIRYVISRKREKAEAFVKWLGKGRGISYEDLSALEGIVFVFVPDRYIKQVYDVLKEKAKAGTVFIHASGYLPSSIFHDADSKGWGRASLHPNFSFSDFQKALERRRDIIFGIEGNGLGIESCIKIVNSISGKYVVIPEDKKPYYHLAAVVAANFLVGLAYLSKRLYEISGVESVPTLHLMETTVENMKKIGIEKALTGPVARGEKEIIRKEGEIFEQVFPEYVDLYWSMVKVLKEVKKHGCH